MGHLARLQTLSWKDGVRETLDGIVRGHGLQKKTEILQLIMCNYDFFSVPRHLCSYLRSKGGQLNRTHTR